MLVIIAAGFTLAAILLFGLALPLSIWEHPGIVRTNRPLATVLGVDPAGALRFAVPVISAFAVYAVAVRLARDLAGVGARLLILGVTGLLALALLPMNPVGAHDVYHNVADARALWLYGDNPLVLPPDAYPNDSFYGYVPAWQSTPSLYGPLWYLVAGVPLPLAGDALWPNVIGQKALTAALLMLVTLATMLLAERIRSGSAVAAGVLVGWNPLLQFETAGNAHNGVLMVLFALLALLAAARGYWPAVFPLLALSVASKYIFLALAPVVLVWMLSRPDVSLRRLLVSLAGGAVTGCALLLPFLGSVDMVSGILRETGFPSFSPSAFLHAAAIRVLGLQSLTAFSAVKLLLLIPFAAGYGSVLRQVRRRPNLSTLISGCFWSIALLLVCASAWFGPWYAALLMPFGAVLTGRRPALIAAIFTFSAMLMYIPYFWLLTADPVLLHGATAGVAFIPAAITLLWSYRISPRHLRPALEQV